MNAIDGAGFWKWLSTELAYETRQSRLTSGELPARPVCLSEVEAVGLMILALDAEQYDDQDLTVTTAHRLSDTLRFRLSRLTS